MYSIYN